MRQSKATKRNMIRLWTLLLCLIVAFAMIQPLGGSYAYAAAAGIGSGSEASNNDGEAASGSAGGDERGSLRNSPAVWYDGTYEGTGNGYEGPVKLAVTIAGGKITEIKDVDQKEAPEYWVKALPVIQTIIDSQSTAVDSISGATVSCDAIKAAVNEALDLAALDPDGPFSSGKGTVKKPYIIDTVKGLQTFAEAVDDGISYSGQYIALGGDLDLSGIENWNPIGGEGPTASASKFAGNFNGKGHVIRGMTIEGEGFSAETNVGLFSALDNTAKVSELTLEDVDIDIKGSAVLRAGGIAGDTVNGIAGDTTNGGAAGTDSAGAASTGTLIDKCSVTGAISADSSENSLVYAGGLIGRAMIWVKASNCWTDADTKAFSRGGNNSGYAGGIFGMSGNNTLIANCATFGDAYGSSPKSTNFGGMAGGLGGMLTCKAWNTYTMGDVTIGNGGSKHEWIGAIAGEFPSGGMIKSGSDYVYPETGAFRDYGYYANDIALTVETWAGVRRPFRGRKGNKRSSLSHRE